MTHHQLNLGFPNLDQKCILALLRSLLILGLIDGPSISFAIFYQTYLCCIIISETVTCKYLVRPSLVTDQIGFGFWQNISFAVNYWWTFWLIIDIAIYLLTLEDQYFLWVTTVPLCVYNPDYIWDAHMQDMLSCVFAWDFKTLKFPQNYRAKYGIVTEYWCIAMRNSTHFIKIKASQQFLLHIIPHNCSEMLDQIIRL